MRRLGRGREKANVLTERTPRRARRSAEDSGGEHPAVEAALHRWVLDEHRLPTLIIGGPIERSREEPGRCDHRLRSGSGLRRHHARLCAGWLGRFTPVLALQFRNPSKTTQTACAQKTQKKHHFCALRMRFLRTFANSSISRAGIVCHSAIAA
jgi:hypothetical protein